MEANEVNKVRLKTLRWSCLGVGCLFLVGSLARHAFVRLEPEGLFTAFFCGSLLIILNFFIKNKIIGLPLGIFIFSTTMYISLILFSFHGPGFLAPAMSIVLLVPIFSGFVGGSFSIITSGLGALILLITVYSMDKFGFMTPVYLSRDDLILSRLVVLIVILFSAVLTSFAYEHAHKALLGILQDRNNDLKDINERMNRLVGSVTHDLRNPIGAIQGLTELLGDSLEGNEEASEYLKSIDISLSSSMEIIDALLESSAIRSGKISLKDSRFLVSDLIDESWSKTDFRASKKGLHHEISPGTSIEIEADRQRLSQVLVNLYSNAIKFTHTGKKIETKISSSENAAVITITDQGVGMSASHLKKIFEIDKPTSTPGTNGEVGTGYGLPLVKQIVELHGGKIFAKSVEGEGTSFDVYIPLTRTN